MVMVVSSVSAPGDTMISKRPSLLTTTPPSVASISALVVSPASDTLGASRPGASRPGASRPAREHRRDERAEW